MDTSLNKTILACATALFVALILAASVKYYTDGTRYEVVVGSPPVAYLLDKREGRAVAYAPATGKDPVFFLPQLPTANDVFGVPDPKR